MSEHVWVCTAPLSSENHFQFGWPSSLGDNPALVSLNNALLIDSIAGLPVDQSRFPSVLESELTRSKGDPHHFQLPQELPPYINWTCPVLSREIVEVVGRYDIGATNIYPVKMRRVDKNEIYDQDFSILNIGVAKETLVPEKSKGIRENAFRRGTYEIGYPENDEICVTPVSMSGPDIWVDPVIVNRCFFISDRLNSALEVAGLAAPFRFVRCRVAMEVEG